MRAQPYLFFNGRCEEALEFYGTALRAQVLHLMHFKDNPDAGAAGCAEGPVDPDKVMHCAFRVGDTEILASDGMTAAPPRFEGFALALAAADDAEARRLFDALADGGAVQMPLGKTFFASSFGVVADRFGVSWMVVTDTCGADTETV